MKPFLWDEGCWKRALTGSKRIGAGGFHAIQHTAHPADPGAEARPAEPWALVSKGKGTGTGKSKVAKPKAIPAAAGASDPVDPGEEEKQLFEKWLNFPEDQYSVVRNRVHCHFQTAWLPTSLR